MPDLTFVDLYGTELDRELGTTDRTFRFTTARRQAAINAAQQEFVDRTECIVRQASIALTTALELDLENYAQDFGKLAKQGISIQIVDANGFTIFIEGDDLEYLSVETLNFEVPGWRSAPPSRPTKVYLRPDGGALKLGLYPPAGINPGEVWTALLPYVPILDDMTADTDVPFAVQGNELASLRPYRRALVHFAAYDLEKLRKDLSRAQAQLQLFESYIQRYQQRHAPQGQRIRLARDYRRPRGWGLHRGNRDPRVWP